MIPIKKVQVTSLENYGKIIDSSSTTDNKATNTYSMRIVDNLLTTQTSTETKTYTRNNIDYTFECTFKRCVNVVTLKVRLTIPAGTPEQMSLAGILNITDITPEWAKVDTSETLNISSVVNPTDDVAKSMAFLKYVNPSDDTDIKYRLAYSHKEDTTQTNDLTYTYNFTYII